MSLSSEVTQAKKLHGLIGRVRPVDVVEKSAAKRRKRLTVQCNFCMKNIQRKQSHILDRRCFCSVICKKSYGNDVSTSEKISISKKKRGKSGSLSPSWTGGKTKWLKRQVLERDKYTCLSCSFSEPDIMCVDHVLPKKKFPELEFEMRNLQTLCPNCHARKTKQDVAKFFPAWNKGNAINKYFESTCKKIGMRFPIIVERCVESSL